MQKTTKGKEEDILFRDIHQYLVNQSRTGEKMDTETQLATRFQVSRYKVRKILDQLSQMGVVDRAQKRGMTFAEVTPAVLAHNISEQIAVSAFDVREHFEARLSLEREILPLALMRVTPLMLSKMDESLSKLKGCLDVNGAALKIHTGFHRQVMEACGNRVLEGFALALLEHWYGLLEQGGELGASFFSDALESDLELLRAIKVGDGQAAEKIVSELLRREMLCLIESA